MDSRTKKDIRKFIKALEKTVSQDDMQDILKRAAKPTINAVKSKIPIERYKRSRYKDGKKVATYMPGNLRRSFRLLNRLNKKERRGTFKMRKVWFGINLHRGKSNGVFAGNRTDGYYAHMVNDGTEHYAGNYFFERGMNAGKRISFNVLKAEYMRRFKQQARKQGLS